MHASCMDLDVGQLKHMDFFSCRVINVWNSLPDFVSFESRLAFRRSVDNVDLISTN